MSGRFTTGIRANDSPNELDLFISGAKLWKDLKIRSFTKERIFIFLLTRPGRSLLVLDCISQFVRVAKQPPVLSLDLGTRCPCHETLALGIEVYREWIFNLSRLDEQQSSENVRLISC